MTTCCFINSLIVLIMNLLSKTWVAWTIFLGLEVSYTLDGLFGQTKYAHDILECAELLDSKSISTPLAAGEILVSDGSQFRDPTLYHSLVRALLYLTITRPISRLRSILSVNFFILPMMITFWLSNTSYGMLRGRSTLVYPLFIVRNLQLLATLTWIGSVCWDSSFYLWLFHLSWG